MLSWHCECNAGSTWTSIEQENKVYYVWHCHSRWYGKSIRFSWYFPTWPSMEACGQCIYSSDLHGCMFALLFPLTAMVLSFNYNSTLGAGFIGNYLSAMYPSRFYSAHSSSLHWYSLYGSLCIQCINFYHRFRGNNRFIDYSVRPHAHCSIIRHETEYRRLLLGSVNLVSL